MKGRRSRLPAQRQAASAPDLFVDVRRRRHRLGQPDAPHAYQQAGTYTATLTVTDSLGRTSQSSDAVTVALVAPTVTIGGPYSGTAGTAISFSGFGHRSEHLRYAGHHSPTSGPSATAAPPPRPPPPTPMPPPVPILPPLPSPIRKAHRHRLHHRHGQRRRPGGQRRPQPVRCGRFGRHLRWLGVRRHHPAHLRLDVRRRRHRLGEPDVRRTPTQQAGTYTATLTVTDALEPYQFLQRRRHRQRGRAQRSPLPAPTAALRVRRSASLAQPPIRPRMIRQPATPISGPSATAPPPRRTPPPRLYHRRYLSSLP